MSLLVDANGNPLTSESNKAPEKPITGSVEIENDARITQPTDNFNPELDPNFHCIEILDTNYIIGEGVTVLVETVPFELMITRVYYFNKRPLEPIGLEINGDPTVPQKCICILHFGNEVAQNEIYKTGKLYYRIGEGMQAQAMPPEMTSQLIGGQ